MIFIVYNYMFDNNNNNNNNNNNKMITIFSNKINVLRD